MGTAIASWGNSDAVRIPRDLLHQAGLRKGDRVSFAVNDKGNLEIIPEGAQHRRISPARGITFESLFKGYQVPILQSTAWPDENMEGAEWEAWSR